MFTAETKEVEREGGRELGGEGEERAEQKPGGERERDTEKRGKGGREMQAEHARPEKIDERDAGKSTLI